MLTVLALLAASAAATEYAEAPALRAAAAGYAGAAATDYAEAPALRAAAAGYAEAPALRAAAAAAADDADGEDAEARALQARAVEYTACTPRIVANYALYNTQSFNFRSVTCSIARTDANIVGTTHSLSIVSTGSKLTLYHTDGADCLSTGNSFSYYTSVSSTARTISVNDAPCYESPCCTIIKCDSSPSRTAAAAPCSYYLASSKFNAFPLPSRSPLPSPSRTRSPSRTPVPTVAVTRSGTPTPTPPRTPTPSRTKISASSRTASPTRTPPAPAAGSQPASWDPRLDSRYAACYTAPILDQGQCGSCYAFAAAYTLSISLCRTAIDAGLSIPGGATPHKQVSPQLMLAVKKVQNGFAQNTFCSGGSPIMLLMSYAVQIHNARLLGKTHNLLTCKSSAAGAPCAAGCNPYTAGGCPAPSGGIVNPAGSTNSSGACNALSYEQKLCPTSNAVDADSQWLSQAAASWTAVPSFSDPGFSGAWAGSAAYWTGVNENDLTQPDIRNLNAMLSNVNPKGWSPAVVEGVKRYLRTKGSLTVAMTVCDNLQSTLGKWFQSGSPPRVYDGPACPGAIDHAVVLIGWTMVPDSKGVQQPAWILRNEWGASWGAWAGAARARRQG